jgi:surface protein
MTTAENLNRIIKAKSDIKQAIEEKGVTVGDLAIDGYAAKINEIKGSVSPISIATSKISFGYSDFETLPDGFDFNGATSFSRLFYFCNKLISLDVTNWDTSNVTNMEEMFFENYKLKTITGLETWNTSNVTTMNKMFDGCSLLTSLDLSNWDTSNVTNMTRMFGDCKGLTEVKMGGDVSEVIKVDAMFNGIKTTGMFYYNPQYDYSKIIEQLPSNWTAVPME